MYVYDGIGNPVALLTDFNTTSFQYQYDPYGVPTLQQSSGGNGVGQNPYAFKSGIQDRATGFVKFGQRWYNPVTGTWTQQDAVDTPLNAANANRYAYAAGDPVNNQDPTGRDLTTILQYVGACFVGSAPGIIIGGITGGPAGALVGA